MTPPIDEQVINFFHALFENVFSKPFEGRIKERLRRNAVVRQVEEAADAASQSLTRFFISERLTEQQVYSILEGFAALGGLIKLDNISNPNVTPETIVDGLLVDLACPESVRLARHEAIYRVALHSVVQVLMLVGPVMSEWQKLNFSSTFELPRRAVNRLNQISEQIDIAGRSGQDAVDERYELSYRDYLLQRFHRIEAGTIRMTTNLDTDLRELFVMPRVVIRPQRKKARVAKLADSSALMDLEAARRFFTDVGGEHEEIPRKRRRKDEIPALDLVKKYPYGVLVGAPGSGKSTFLEWLQVKLASAEVEFVMAGRQAIPLLLRVRQLDPHNLPLGSSLIEKATASKDRAALMPRGWIERQMKAGRVLLMLDGLDETEPDLRDKYVLTWFLKLCEEYPSCRYIVSSRPVGYPPGALDKYKFVECDLLDFDDNQIRTYTRHWCTAVRLAQNESEQEARREGAADGDRIVDSFEGNPYIRNLARNPLMLSAICLVNYFEGGHLPQDRALLYKLCVEGLLHNWDQRRGIRSEFSFDEKMRVCREVAVTMQADNRAEYEADRVQQVFAAVLRDSTRAKKLFEHIRYRTGLLIERRPNVFAFAHLTFQEYLAARAVHEGNQTGIGVERLIQEHGDGRWQEVIPLYCGLTPAPAAHDLIKRLIAQPDTELLSTVLAEAYLLCGPDLSQDLGLRRKVLKRVAIAPSAGSSPLERFPIDEVAPIANSNLGKIQSPGISESYQWLRIHSDLLDISSISKRLQGWREMNPFQIAESIYLLIAKTGDKLGSALSFDDEVFRSPGPAFDSPTGVYASQAEIALEALMFSSGIQHKSTHESVFELLLRILRILSDVQAQPGNALLGRKWLFAALMEITPPDPATWPEFVAVSRRLAKHLSDTVTRRRLNNWANRLETASAKKVNLKAKTERKPTGRSSTRQLAKTKSKRRRRK